MYRQTSSPNLSAPRSSASESTNDLEKRYNDNAIDMRRLSCDKEEHNNVCYDNAAYDKSEQNLYRTKSDESTNNLTVKQKLNSWFSQSENSTNFLKAHRQLLLRTAKVGLVLLYNVYVGFAMYCSWNDDKSWCKGVKFLVIITSIAYMLAFIQIVLVPSVVKPLMQISSPYYQKLHDTKYFAIISWSGVWISIIVFLIVDTEGNRRRLISVAGLLLLLLIGFVFSAHPHKVIWRQVQWGVMLQFFLGLIILRWNVGREIFLCLGDKVKVFLGYTDMGSKFVFGYLVDGKMQSNVADQAAIFAFRVLSVVIFFSFMVSIAYYYGLMQAIVIKLGWLLQKTVGTTACESVSAASNIFLGQTEAPLMIQPYLNSMTKSELHAVMTGGFATIAGSVMAAYISFGVNASHLLSASVMSAPAALAFSKLSYPETEESFTTADNIIIEKRKENNVLEAATNGVCIAISMVANIAANLIAFIAFIALLDGMLAWFGSLVHFDYLSFEWLMSKIFVPLSFAMGVEMKDSEKVAQLVGLKTVLNELLAYKKLTEFQHEGALSARSEAIATFALCGFSNIGAIGIQIGGLGALVPQRKSDVSELAVRAMLSGSAACCMTACIAGALLHDH